MPTYAVLFALAFLLPGAAFYAGQQQAEPFGRETSVATIVEELARILFVSLLVHTIALLLWFAVGRLRSQFSPDQVLGLASRQAQAAYIEQKAGRPATAESITLGIDWMLWIMLYIVTTSLIAYLIGRIWKRHFFGGSSWQKRSRRDWAYELVQAPFRAVPLWVLGREAGGRGLAAGLRHFWNALRDRPYIGSYTVVFTATKLTDERNHLMYRGRLRDISFARGGRINFVTLEAPSRSYLRLKRKFPETVPFRRGIGESNPGPGSGYRDLSFLVINAEEVSNYVFERYTFRFTRATILGLFEAGEKLPKLTHARRNV